MQLFAPPPADAQRAVLMKLLLSRYTQHVPALSPHPSFSQRATSSLMLLFPQLVKPQQLQRCQTAGDCDIISQTQSALYHGSISGKTMDFLPVQVTQHSSKTKEPLCSSGFVIPSFL